MMVWTASAGYILIFFLIANAMKSFEIGHRRLFLVYWVDFVKFIFADFI